MEWWKGEVNRKKERDSRGRQPMQSPPSAGLRVGEVIMCNRRRVQHPEACRSLMTPEAGIKKDRSSKEEFKFATAARYYGSIG
jgi:hypothetical protein